MEGELAVNWALDLHGRTAEDIFPHGLDGEHTLPIIPIADLGDLDISAGSSPQNREIQWSNNNNNDTVHGEEYTSNWIGTSHHFNTGMGMKRQLENSTDGQRGTKYLRALLSKDNNTHDNTDKSHTINSTFLRPSNIQGRDVQHHRLSSPSCELIRSDLNPDPPTAALTVHKRCVSADRLSSTGPRHFEDTVLLHAPSGIADNKIRDESISSNMEQVAVLLPPVADNTGVNPICDGKYDSPPAVQYSMGLPHNNSQLDCWPARGESIPPSSSSSVVAEAVSHPHPPDQDTGHTQNFLDWAMEKLLKSADSLLDMAIPSSNKSSQRRDTSSDEVSQEGMSTKQSSTHAPDRHSTSPGSAGVTSPSPHFHKCTLCLLCFRNSDDLLAHLQSRHSDVRCYECPHCAAKLDDLQLLGDHMKVHSLISNISTDDVALDVNAIDGVECDVCRALFPSSDALRRHVDVQHRARKEEEEVASPQSEIGDLPELNPKPLLHQADLDDTKPSRHAAVPSTAIVPTFIADIPALTDFNDQYLALDTDHSQMKFPLERGMNHDNLDSTRQNDPNSTEIERVQNDNAQSDRSNQTNDLDSCKSSQLPRNGDSNKLRHDGAIKIHTNTLVTKEEFSSLNSSQNEQQPRGESNLLGEQMIDSVCVSQMDPSHDFSRLSSQMLPIPNSHPRSTHTRCADVLLEDLQSSGKPMAHPEQDSKELWNQQKDPDTKSLSQKLSVSETQPSMSLWVQLTVSNPVMPAHMPNYTTYKCPTCNFPFTSENILSKHFAKHSKERKLKKRTKDKSKKSAKTGKLAKKQSRRQKKDNSIGQTTNGKSDNLGAEKNDTGRSAAASCSERDQNEESDTQNENPQVVNKSIWSKHVQLFQEYL